MLDNTGEILAADKKQVLKATEMLADQCQQAWEETQAITLPAEYSDVHHLVIAGMGGSHLGARLIDAVFQSELRFPLQILHQYDIPGYISEDSLVIATSFSGNTEETLSFVEQAQAKRAKIITISSGGKLAEFAHTHNLPNYTFHPKYNPSMIPRYGAGYLFVSQMIFLSKIGAITLTKSDLDAIISTLHLQKAKYEPSVPLDQNPAKQSAQSLTRQAVILVAAEHLIGSAYIFKNQINESAKHFSTLFTIPELDHHLLESLAHPASNPKHLHFLFFNSSLYHPQNQKRFKITQDIVSQQSISTSRFEPVSTTPLSQAFETLAFSSYMAFYLAFLNHVDPGPNPWVDHLKENLA